MKKLTFKVSAPKEGSIIALIKEVNKFACRIQLDVENGLVTVENVSDTMIDTVIELIDNYYTLLGVDIDNSVESDAVEPIVETAAQSFAEPETIPEPEVAKKTIGPQSEDDLIIEKVEYKNEYVEQLLNKLIKTAYWAMYKKNVSEREIGDFIWTSINEISMRYNGKDSIEFSVGDVIDCNYGTHLSGEINGIHVSAIVCNISSTGMAYLVPITKTQENLNSHSYLTITTPDDIIYDTRDYVGGTALLDKGKYVRPERFHEVIGKTSTAFFTKVLNQLAITFDFTDTNSDFEPASAETTKQTVESDSETMPTEKVLESTTTKVETKPANKKVSGVEAALLETVGTAFDKLDSSKSVEEQLDSFLTDIGMPKSEKILKQSFVIACDIQKTITYEIIIHELHKMYPNVNNDIIKASLKDNFKKWLKNYPDLAKKCPKISLMVLLKAFAKRF